MSAQLKPQPVFDPPKAGRRPPVGRKRLPPALVKTLLSSALFALGLSFIWLTGVQQVRAQHRARARTISRITQAKRRAWQAYEAQKPLRDPMRIAEYVTSAGMLTYEGRPMIVEGRGPSR
jgi:hypothetical protein